MTDIHPQAYVDPRAQLGAGVRVAPLAYVGPDVVLGDGCMLHPRAMITGRTTVGPNNEFFPGAVVGTSPQDLKYKGTLTELHIGESNIFREHVTVHCGTEVGGGRTRVGSHGRFLAGVHIAHDVRIGDNVVIANNALLAGHVCIEDCCHIGGAAAFHHFVTIGKFSYTAGMARVTVDVPPYMIMEGYPARVRGININGMQRWNIDRGAITALREAYKLLFGKRGDDEMSSLMKRVEQLEGNGPLDEHTRYLCDFLRRSTSEGVYGRYLESKRRDSPADHAGFYHRPEPGGGGAEDSVARS